VSVPARRVALFALRWLPGHQSTYLRREAGARTRAGAPHTEDVAPWAWEVGGRSAAAGGIPAATEGAWTRSSRSSVVSGDHLGAGLGTGEARGGAARGPRAWSHSSSVGASEAEGCPRPTPSSRWTLCGLAGRAVHAPVRAAAVDGGPALTVAAVGRSLAHDGGGRRDTGGPGATEAPVGESISYETGMETRTGDDALLVVEGAGQDPDVRLKSMLARREQ
jgi:hypothetical protein